MTKSTKTESMCDDCKLLVGAGMYTKPHANLVFVDGKKVSSIMGRLMKQITTTIPASVAGVEAQEQ
jgi:hypothetical protein